MDIIAPAIFPILVFRALLIKQQAVFSLHKKKTALFRHHVDLGFYGKRYEHHYNNWYEF